MILALLPSPALAGACEKLAGGWNGVRHTALTELIDFWTFSNVHMTLLVILALLSGKGILFEWVGGWLALLLFGLLFVHDNAALQAAESEGCIGPYWLRDLSLMIALLLLLIPRRS